MRSDVDSSLDSHRLLPHQGIPLTLSILIALTLLLVLCLDKNIQVSRLLRRSVQRPRLLSAVRTRPPLTRAVQIVLAISSVTDVAVEDTCSMTV